MQGELADGSEWTPAKYDISQIVWSPLAQGMLTGKYRPGQPLPTDSRAASSWLSAMMRELVMNDHTLEV